MATEIPPKVSIAVILLAIAGSCYYCNTDRARETPVSPNIWGRVGCEEAVKAQLVAPTTATIEWQAEGQLPDTSRYQYWLRGEVTSQNVFSAMITKKFYCYHNGQQDFRGLAVIAP